MEQLVEMRELPGTDVFEVVAEQGNCASRTAPGTLSSFATPGKSPKGLSLMQIEGCCARPLMQFSTSQAITVSESHFTTDFRIEIVPRLNTGAASAPTDNRKNWQNGPLAYVK